MYFPTKHIFEEVPKLTNDKCIALDKRIFESKIVNIFLPISFT